MTLVWKLLRQHISTAQLLGFFLANLVGMLIILLALQIYVDTKALSKNTDILMREDFLIVSKKISSLAAITSKAPSFSATEIAELQNQPFVEELAPFSTSNFKVYAYFDAGRGQNFGTQMFFEAVPDQFIDVQSKRWTYTPGDDFIPLILPKTYLDLYNYGFAQSRQMPRLSESILSSINLRIFIQGNGHRDEFNARIVGFSNRLQTILVPQAFLDYANPLYQNQPSDLNPTSSRQNSTKQPSRLILRLSNRADQSLATFLHERDYQTDADKLQDSQNHYLLNLFVTILLSVGLLISALSFYILMLSIFLLLQKNSRKLQNLLLIGFTVNRIARPYQTLTFVLNLAVAALALLILHFIRNAYIEQIAPLTSTANFPTLLPAALAALALLLLVTAFNTLAIQNKIRQLRKA